MSGSSSWRADPSGRHEERYFVGDEPTDLVRDRGVDDVDPVTWATDLGAAPAVPPTDTPSPDMPRPMFSSAGDTPLPAAPGPIPPAAMPPFAPIVGGSGALPPGPPLLPTGAPLSDPVSGGAVQPVTEPKSSRRAGLIVALALVVVILVVAGGAVFALRKSPEKAYLDNLTTAGSLGQFNGDASAIAAARKTCADIESGSRKPQGSKADQYAVQAFCPDFSSEFKILDTVNVTATFALIDTSRYSSGIESTGGGGCSGDGGYGDINSTTQAVLKNSDGKEIARTEIGAGKGSTTICTFTFNLDVTEGEKSYILSVGHRGESTYTWDEIKKPGAIALTLGGS